MENKQQYKNYYRLNKLKNNKSNKKKKVLKVIKINDKLTSEFTSIIFFDLEMNCSFHKEENHGVGETISIGAVKYKISTEETTDFYSIIRPTFNNVMSSKIIELTNLLQDEVNEAKSFKEVLLTLEDWVKQEKCIFVSWGPDDIRVLLGDNDRNGYKLDIINTIKTNFIDFQSEYGLHRKSNQAISLKNALTYYKVEFEGSQHNALDDAHNLFRVYKKYKEEIIYINSIDNENSK
ncbi:3'-5' exonuclease [Clostridium gasigenes]|uniref:Inhibitor of the KinA pathway to sporulation, predicted exonuclease n=1 Tax=Clostridium gasigenes TaxID=94869 RepID=A0A1H0NF61_9CLOT|nr:3'-5' exonuclease [Clostridium gasigenes]MBU3135161.1 exonuclease domain-containing protein [Clostridium gasigenes]SDO91231.1 Inhibitor of the KinA pathway to sporulation, predicted exonuclease [Clostridium gasigenes]